MKNIEKYLLKKHRDNQKVRALFGKSMVKRRSRQNTKNFRQKYFVTADDVVQEIHRLIFCFWKNWMMESFGLEFNFGIDYVDHELEITHVTKTDDQEQKSFSMKELSRSDTCKILGTLLCSIWQFQNSPIRGLDDYWMMDIHDENTHRDIERFLVEEAKSLNKQFFFVTQEEFNNAFDGFESEEDINNEVNDDNVNVSNTYDSNANNENSLNNDIVNDEDNVCDNVHREYGGLLDISWNLQSMVNELGKKLAKIEKTETIPKQSSSSNTNSPTRIGKKNSKSKKSILQNSNAKNCQ